MKNKRTRFASLLAFCCLFMVYPQQQAEAKFWGKKTTVNRVGVQANGACYENVTTQRCKFWICGKGHTYDRGCE
jgi:hypothetical protein